MFRKLFSTFVMLFGVSIFGLSVWGFTTDIWVETPEEVIVAYGSLTLMGITGLTLATSPVWWRRVV